MLAPQHGSAGQVLRRRVLRPVGRKPAPLPNRGPIPTFPLPWSHTACTLRARQGAGLPWMQQSRRDRGWSGRGRSQQKGGEIVYKATCRGRKGAADTHSLLAHRSFSRSLDLSLSRSLDLSCSYVDSLHAELPSGCLQHHFVDPPTPQPLHGACSLARHGLTLLQSLVSFASLAAVILSLQSSYCTCAPARKRGPDTHVPSSLVAHRVHWRGCATTP